MSVVDNLDDRIRELEFTIYDIRDALKVYVAERGHVEPLECAKHPDYLRHQASLPINDRHCQCGLDHLLFVLD
jgi:hypothetical protein